MLIDFGLNKNAEQVFADLAKRNPRSAEALQGLADAEFADAEYPAAQQAYQRLMTIDPANAVAGGRAQEGARVLALDPAAPALKAASRYARSRDLLATTLYAMESCYGGEGKLPPSISDAAKNAKAALERKRQPTSLGDAVDENEQLALQLWKARPATCAVDDALTRALGLLER